MVKQLLDLLSLLETCLSSTLCLVLTLLVEVLNVTLQHLQLGLVSPVVALLDRVLRKHGALFLQKVVLLLQGLDLLLQLHHLRVQRRHIRIIDWRVLRTRTNPLQQPTLSACCQYLPETNLE